MGWVHGVRKQAAMQAARMTHSVSSAHAVWHAGMHLRVLMDAEATGGPFALCELVAPPGAGTPIHRHEHEDEVIWVRSGRLGIWQRDLRLADGPARHSPDTAPLRASGNSIRVRMPSLP